MLLDNIKRYAKEKGITLEELETRACLGKKTIWRWNGSNNPSVDKVGAVAFVLGVTVDDLLKDKTA